MKIKQLSVQLSVVFLGFVTASTALADGYVPPKPTDPAGVSINNDALAQALSSAFAGAVATGVGTGIGHGGAGGQGGHGGQGGQGGQGGIGQGGQGGAGGSANNGGVNVKTEGSVALSMSPTYCGKGLQIAIPGVAGLGMVGTDTHCKIRDGLMAGKAIGVPDWELRSYYTSYMAGMLPKTAAAVRERQRSARMASTGPVMIVLPNGQQGRITSPSAISAWHNCQALQVHGTTYQKPGC